MKVLATVILLALTALGSLTTLGVTVSPLPLDAAVLSEATTNI